MYEGRDSLELVRHSDAEWRKQYAATMNMLLPFEKCLLHAGSASWVQGAGYTDLQLRIYVVDEQPIDVISRVVARGPDAVREVIHDRETRVPVAVHRPKWCDGWETVDLQFLLWFGDYGGQANLAFSARRFDDRTVVFVAMFEGSIHDEVSGGFVYEDTIIRTMMSIRRVPSFVRRPS